MSSIDRYRSQIAGVTLEAVGAHYLHGSFGNCPGVCNGHPTMDFRTTMLPNSYARSVPATGRPHHHAAAESGSIQIYAAGTNIKQPVYCWGRPQHADVAHLPPVPADILNSPPSLRAFVEREPANSHRWPRTIGRQDHGTRDQIVMGESCEGKRHFDCIGFVTWAMWRIFRTTSIQDIAHCQSYAARLAQHHPENVPTQSQYATGDILIFNVNHIAFVLNEREMIEAQGENYGVTRSPFRGGVTNVLRPTSQILNGLWNVPYH